MDKIWRQGEHEEVQDNAHLILWTHVLHRGFATGVPVGLAIHGVRRAMGKPSSIIASSARGGIGGMVFVGLGLFGLMRDKDEYAWQERSWRLLSNKGQNETDIASLAGGVAGAVWGSTRRSVSRNAVKALGGAGLGSAIGTFGYMTFRSLRA